MCRPSKNSIKSTLLIAWQYALFRVYYKYEREEYIMKKFVMTILIVNGLIWTLLSNIAKADDYNTAVIGHVIQSKVNGENVDVNALMSYELEKLAHKYSIEMVSILQAYLPAILDGVMTDLRLQADEKYKCALLKDSKIEDDCKWLKYF